MKKSLQVAHQVIYRFALSSKLAWHATALGREVWAVKPSLIRTYPQIICQTSRSMMSNLLMGGGIGAAAGKLESIGCVLGVSVRRRHLAFIKGA